MYEIETHQKNLETIAEAFSALAKERDIEAAMVIVVRKNNDIEIESVYGRVTQFEWRGLLDYAKDVVKGEYSR